MNREPALPTPKVSALVLQFVSLIAGCAFNCVLCGCASGIINSGVAANASSTALSASLTTADATPPLGTQTTVTWQTEGATTVEVEGDDLASGESDGGHTSSATQDSIYFLAAADEQGNVKTESLAIRISLTAAQQQSVHDQWLAGVRVAAASQGCNGQLLIQQNSQSAAALLEQAKQSHANCIVLLPVSTSSTPIYNIGLAFSQNGNDILFISDEMTTPFQNSIL